MKADGDQTRDNLTRGQNIGRRLGCILPLAVLLLFVCDQIYNHSLIWHTGHVWEGRLRQAHLVGAKQGIVFDYLQSHGLEVENTHGWFDQEQDPALVKNSGVNQLGPTYGATILGVADTCDPFPLNWTMQLDFQFDKRGRLLFYHVEPDASGL